MFNGASSFNQDLSSWNVSSVTSMRYMFSDASSFNQDLSSWNVSSVTKMYRMFDQASSFNNGLCAWGSKLPSFVRTSGMFIGTGCYYQSDPFRDVDGYSPFCGSSCKEECFANRDELQTAIRTYVEDETNCTSVARNANPGCNSNDKEWIQKKYGYSMGRWCVSNVIDMSFLFTDMPTFNEDISGWDVSLVTNMEGMFEGAPSFNQDLSSWNVSNVVDAERMFDGATSFDISAICGWKNGWRELFGCKDGSIQTKSPSSSPQEDPNNNDGKNLQSSSASFRRGQGLHVVVSLMLSVRISSLL